MIQLFLHIYVFIAWTGAWSTHAGFAALIFLFLWLATLAIGIICALFVPGRLSRIISFSVGNVFGKNAGKAALNIADGVDIAFNVVFLIPILICAFIATIGYLVGLGDLLSWLLSFLFPKGGYLFSETSAPWWAYIVPLYLCYNYYSLLDRFEVIDLIKTHISCSAPIIKQQVAGLAHIYDLISSHKNHNHKKGQNKNESNNCNSVNCSDDTLFQCDQRCAQIRLLQILRYKVQLGQ